MHLALGSGLHLTFGLKTRETGKWLKRAELRTISSAHLTL